MASRRPVSLETTVGADGSERSSSAYRIEHRRGDAVAVLAHTDDPLAQHSVLAPLAVQLVDVGATGVLVLIEEASGDVLARRALHLDGDGNRVTARAMRTLTVHDAAADDVP